MDAGDWVSVVVCVLLFFVLLWELAQRRKERRERERTGPRSLGDTVWIDGQQFIIMFVSRRDGETMIELLDKESAERRYRV